MKDVFDNDCTRRILYVKRKGRVSLRLIQRRAATLRLHPMENELDEHFQQAGTGCLGCHDSGCIGDPAQPTLNGYRHKYK